MKSRNKRMKTALSGVLSAVLLCMLRAGTVSASGSPCPPKTVSLAPSAAAPEPPRPRMHDPNGRALQCETRAGCEKLARVSAAGLAVFLRTLAH